MGRAFRALPLLPARRNRGQYRETERNPVPRKRRETGTPHVVQERLDDQRRRQERHDEADRDLGPPAGAQIVARVEETLFFAGNGGEEKRGSVRAFASGGGFAEEAGGLHTDGNAGGIIVGTGSGLSASLARLFAKNGMKVAISKFQEKSNITPIGEAGEEPRVFIDSTMDPGTTSPPLPGDPSITVLIVGPLWPG